ncbi:dihydroxyacetone phosphate acyltransferase-like [Lineus longissimus]|uniref:dihydroxyacetone phosphate acyltransferase-like n=1 Tax=Lineus longissimus TaxID=88925 RepID=UPI002B4D7E6C
MSKQNNDQSRNTWIKEDDPIKATSMSRHKDDYEDILRERRLLSDFNYVTKKRQQVPVYKYNHPRTPKQVKVDVLKSDRVKHAIEQVMMESGASVAEVQKETEAIMNEMGHTFSMGWLRGVAYFIVKVMKKLFQNIYVNEEGIERVRALCKEYPVVLMPTHRSYLDFLLLSYVFFHYDLPLPVIAAAMDFMSMKFVGNLLRNCGAFFIRRSFGTDKLYWAVFTEYVQTHLCNGDAPCEFYVEGTRSRTGKTYVPKRGMLSVVLEPYFKANVADVMILPVSMSHDRILEESLYAYELLGIPKPKESTSGLLKARGVLSEDYGNVHFFIGEPISIRHFSVGKIDRIVHGLQPRYISGLTSEEQDLCQDLAYDIVLRHQQNMVISPWALIATVMIQNREGIYLSDLMKDVEWLKRSIANLGGYVDWPGNASAEEIVRLHISLHQNLVQMSPEDFVELKRIIAPHTKKPVRDDIMITGATHLMLASYRNHLIHCFARVGLVAIAVNACCDETLQINDLYLRYTFLEKLLCKDFIFRPGRTRENFELAVKVLTNSSVLTLNAVGDIVVKKSTNKYNTFLSQMFEPFLLGYWVLCQYLLSLTLTGTRPIAKQYKHILKESQALVTRLLQEGVVKHFEMLSLDMLGNGLNAIIEMGAVTKQKRENQDYLIPSHVEVSAIANEIAKVVEVPHVPVLSIKSKDVVLPAKL